MSAAQSFNSIWAWSKACKPFREVTARLTNIELESVTDSIYGAGSFGIMLTVTLADNRILQNNLLISPKTIVWERELSDSQGQILLNKPVGYDGAGAFEDVPIDQGFLGCMLGISRSDSEIILSVATLNQNGNILRQAEAPIAFLNYSQLIAIANLGIYGYGAGSKATFFYGKFEGGLRFEGVNDMTFDGEILGPQLPNYPHAFSAPCNLRMPQPDETSNLLVDAILESQAGLNLLFHV